MAGIFPCRRQRALLRSVGRDVSMNRTEYLKSLTEQIQNKNARQLVLEEVAAHIEDQKEAYLLSGKSAEEAEELAVKEMGDPIDAGTKLNQIHRPKTDFWMLGAMVLLTLIGIFMQSIIRAGFDHSQMAVTYSARTILFNLAGFCLMFLVYFADYRLLGKFIWPFYGFYLAAAVFIRNVPYFEYGHYLTVQTTVNILFVPLFAAFCYYYRGEKGRGILKSLGLLFFNMLFLLFTGSYFSASVFFSLAACLITLCAAAWKGIYGGRKKLQTGMLVCFSAGFPALFLTDILLFHGRIFHLAEYQIRRIQVLLNPAAYDAGYQTMLVRKQLSDASLFGGGSIGEAGAMSGAWCDYVLICLASYFGLLIAIAVVAVIGAFLARSLRIAFLQNNRLGFLLAVSSSSILILKTVVYVAMNFGVGPMVGIDMPFLSYGLCCTLTNFLLMGIILSVYRNTNLLTEYREAPFRLRLRFEKVSGK